MAADHPQDESLPGEEADKYLQKETMKVKKANCLPTVSVYRVDKIFRILYFFLQLRFLLSKMEVKKGRIPIPI